MVLEQFLDRKTVIRHFSFTFFLSMAYVFVAYGVQAIFFPGQSLATVLLLTILLAPSLHHLVAMEEKIERYGVSHFFKRHRTIFKCYFGAFLGILAGFLIIGSVQEQTLSYQTTQLENEHLSQEMIEGFIGQPYEPTMTTAFALFSHNIEYLLAGFVLSIFYGAGAVFLLVYNASFFAAFVMELFTRWAAASQLTAVSFLHLLPESAGYILMAMAGASLSRALIHEKLTGQAFKNVLKNDVILLIFSVLFILLAAFIETYVTAVMFHRII